MSALMAPLMSRSATLVALAIFASACSDSSSTTTTTAAAEVPVSTTSAPGALPLDNPLPITPAQAEGPYYPPEKPQDRDNDLTSVGGSTTLAEGERLFISGLLLRPNGSPIVGATVEIWQVDAGGIYWHPDFPATANRDPNFQFYGESETIASGEWRFVTVLPASYEGRPRHIHLKVRPDGAELLTTQLYLAGDPLLDSDGIFSSVENGTLLVLDPKPITTDAGEEAFTATQLLVIDP
jgi:protocatechuate 3,4-dioxygenase beta subunit